MLWKRQPSAADVLERLESLERRFKTLLADVDEYFHLVRRAENRMIKKSAMIEQHENPGDGNGEVISDSPSPFPSLSPRQSQAQIEILRRRANLKVG